MPILVRLKLVLCNRYDLPMVEFKMARRQGAAREYVLCDLGPRCNAGAGPSRVCGTQPSGPQLFGRTSASLPRPAPNAFGAALRSLFEIRPNFLRPLASHTGYTTLVALVCFAFSAPAFAKPIALVGGRLIDGFGGLPLANSVILIVGEGITAVGTVDTLKTPHD